MSGKLVTLSCKTCDNHIGTTYDDALIKEKKFRDFEMGLIEKTVDISCSGGKLPGCIKMNKEGESPSVSLWAVHPKEPKYPRFVQELSAQGNRWKIDFEINSDFSTRKRDISLLHSAFLMMFFCFGYEYILSENAKHVRQVINGSDTSWDLSKLVSSFTLDKPLPVKLPMIGLLWEPREISSFVVIIPSSGKKNGVRGIKLPGFGQKGYDAYQHLLSSPKHPLHSRIQILTNNSIKRLNMQEWVGSCESAWNFFTSAPQL